MKKGKQMRYFMNVTPYFAAGAVLAIAGFAIYWYAFEIWVLGTPIMAIGVVLLIVGFALRESDTSFTAYFNSKIESLTSGRYSDIKPDYTAAEFSFEGNEFSKLDSSQKPRSELFVRTDIYFGKNTLTIETFRVNAAKETIDNQKLEFPLAEVTASVDNIEIRCAGLLKKVSLMTVRDNNKSLTFPVRYNDIDVDRLTEKINQAKARV
jgi:hypothetical protein